MKALLKLSKEAKDAALKIVPQPVPSDGEVIVKVHAAGVCGTDLKIFQSHYHSYKTPIIMGHELSGVVHEVGPNVKLVHVGDRVVVRTIVSSCGKCLVCLSGRENLCSEKRRIGFDQDGAFAEYIKLPEDLLYVLPKEVDLDTAVLMEPVAVVVHALKPVKMQSSDVVLVIGAGPIGLLALLMCKANGAAVTVSGLSKDMKRLEMAKAMGADFIIVADQADDAGLREMKLLKGGMGADIVLECSGTSGGVNQGLSLCRAGGSYVQIGTRSEPVTIDFMKIAYKEIKTYGSIGHNKRDWEDSIAILKRQIIDLTPLLKQSCQLEEWEDGFKRLEVGQDVKLIFKMGS